MTYSISFYYNHCVLGLLGHDLRANMYTNALETVFSVLVYSNFLSFLPHFKT
jgi:hypothetical protein